MHRQIDGDIGVIVDVSAKTDSNGDSDKRELQ